jgi:hypothetical protein
MISPGADALSDVHPRDEDGLPTPSRTRRRRRFGVVAGAIFALVVLAAMWPVTFDSREELFEIPKGTWARRMAGEKREILPSEIHLIVGIRNVLMLKNSDDVPQIFGPTLLMPGQTLRLPPPLPAPHTRAGSSSLWWKQRRPGRGTG